MQSTPTPARISEGIRTELGQQLEAHLTPLVAFCDAQRANDNLSESEFRHVFALGKAIDALLAYDEATETLLGQYQEDLRQATEALATRVPTLDAVVLLRAWRHERGLRERLSSLYATHAVFTPPPGYEPHPLTLRVNRFLASPSMQAYAALPLASRQALNSLTPADLHAHVESRKAQA